jgi:hypothetical protein
MPVMGMAGAGVEVWLLISMEIGVLVACPATGDVVDEIDGGSAGRLQAVVRANSVIAPIKMRRDILFISEFSLNNCSVT